MPKSERSEQMLREQQNEACFDFDANEVFKMAQPFAFGHENFGVSPFLFILAPNGLPEQSDGIPLEIYLKNKLKPKLPPKGGNPWG